MLSLLALLQIAIAPPPAVAPAPPVDWSGLAPLAYAEPPQITAAMTRFVSEEVAAGRCRQARPADGHYVVRLDIAALIDATGRLTRLVPRAIDCPTVEQYGVGLVQRFARDNLQGRAASATGQWYRATLVFDWTG